MNSENSQRNETQNDYQILMNQQPNHNVSAQDYPLYQTTTNYQTQEKLSNMDYSGNNFIGTNTINRNHNSGPNPWFYNNTSMLEEDSKDEEEQDNQSFIGNQTLISKTSQRMDTNNDQDNYLNENLQRQYQTQNVNRKYLQRQNIFQNHQDKQNLFSNSFDESAPQLDMKPQRNCKSSTRMNKGQIKQQAFVPQIPVPQLVHNNMSSGSGVLTAGSINRSQGAFNNYIKNKQMQNSYQQAILSQLQRANTQNSFDMKNLQDLSNRSFNQTPGNMMSNSFVMNQYFGQTINNNSQTKPITPHNVSMSGHAQLQKIMSAGSQMNPRNSQGISSSIMDPYAYLRQKQQKYKSSRSNQANNIGSQYYKNNTHIIANSAYLLQQRKGNQTQKTNNIIDKSRCSSSGSALGNASMTTTMTGIKSLSEVKNPSMFISWRFCDKKLTQLNDIGQFKNLTDLDISGNLLQTEVSELRQLQFLKKLNLSNNQISEIYPLPHNLEYLNLSNNLIKSINDEIGQHFKNLTTLDITNNQVENIEGLSQMKRLKRLIAKNNQISTTLALKENNSLIELDLESNSIDNFKELFSGLFHKSDILVINLKMTPVILMIHNYDQLIQELQNLPEKIDQTELDWFKGKLKFYNNGSLYRTKRVFIRIKTALQHSKRSSSNFSNGSSSCGRQGTNTGGRVGNTSNSNKNNSSTMNAFSPLLNNTVTTPNYQYTTQRQEDIEQLYDEILDEEEDHERKQNKLKKRRLRKENGLTQDDSQDEDEDESFYEDEEYNNPSMSCEEDIDDLQSYRNQNNHNHHDILNESTADFKKEIRQINEELREQLGSEYLNENAIGNMDHVKSLHSTQSISTNKKNPISFKLDLSKCTQQQSEEEDFDNKGSNDQENDDYDIPGLNTVNVTDDSFRQLQKQQSQQQSLRHKLEKGPSDQIQNETQKNTLREYNPTKPLSKQIIIPKLQLGQLQSMSSLHQIPIKQSINQSLNINNSKKSLCSIKTFKNEEEESNRIKNVTDNNPNILISNEECKRFECMSTRDELDTLKSDYQTKLEQLQLENQELKSVILDIQYQISQECQDYKTLPTSFRTYINQIKEENAFNKDQVIKLQTKLDKLQAKLKKQQNSQQAEFNIKIKENEKTINELQELLKIKEQILSNRQNSQEFSLNLKQLSQNLDIIKRTQSTNYENQMNLIQNSYNFYQTEQSNSKLISARRDSQNDINSSVIENVSQFPKKKRFTCDLKKIKRPQSVAGHRKSNCYKINSLLRPSENTNQSQSIIDDNAINEYGSTNQENLKTCDQQSVNQSQNKKVGHYIERLKERNSSLQERLNGSFGSSNPKTNVSPLNINKLNLNLTNQQELQFCNPYIISPANDDASCLNLTAQSNSNMGSNNQRVSLFTAHIANTNNTRQVQSKENTVIRKISNIDSTSSINELSGREYQTAAVTQLHQYSGHSKTQRLNVKKIQYNQFFLNNINSGQMNKQNESSIQNKNANQIPIKDQNSSLSSQPATEYQYQTSQQFTQQQQFSLPTSKNLTSKQSHNNSTNISQQLSKPSFNQLKIQNINQTFDASLNFYPPKKSERAIISSKSYMSNQSYRDQHQNNVQLSMNQFNNAGQQQMVQAPQLSYYNTSVIPSNQTSIPTSINSSCVKSVSNNGMNNGLQGNSFDQRSFRRN